jgi:alkanesulfonate monooxygenase SsuD/methylene tetrahydromethanopterin reductase-like flavin-dependent oxidoreductase (luciferase family)
MPLARPQLGAYFMSDDSAALIASVQAAERAGYRRAFLNDAHTLWQDVYVHMTRVLDSTSQIVVSSGVTNPVTRHFSVAASAHGTLAQIHPGRVVMGLGRGDAAVHAMGLAPMSTKEFGRQTRQIRSLLQGEPVSVAGGKEFRIRWLGETPVPIMIGATGPRNLWLAGGVADIVQLEVGVTDAAIRWGIGNVRAGAEAAGRNPDDVAISIVCAMWVSDDIDEARTRCSWAATSAANHIEEVMRNPGHGMPEEMTSVVERRRAVGYQHDYESHLEETEAERLFLTDEVVDSFGIAGDAERCRARLADLGRLGVSEVASGFLNSEFDQVRRVGEEIIGQ